MKECKKLQKKAGSTRLTLLDPFTSRGVLEPAYGKNNFGKTADYCELYLNSDDPVPSTNEPLPFSHTFDVTKSSQRSKFIPLEGDSMHSWPCAFYGLNWADKIDGRVCKKQNSDLLFNPPNHAVKKRGEVTVVP